MLSSLGSQSFLLNVLLSIAIGSNQICLASADPQSSESASAEAGLDWDYEPRVWSPDDEEAHDFGILEEFVDDKASTTGASWKQSAEPETQSAINHNANIRDKSYFFDTKRRKLKLKRTKRQDAAGQKCDQYWVDVKETVVCDNSRCDKLEFEWPQHSNQLVVIQTTKVGMRFHRSEFAMADLRAFEPLSSTKRQATENPQSRVKFDIFEIFKPKPTSTTATPTTASTSPEAAVTSPATEQPTSSSPAAQNKTAPASTAKPETSDSADLSSFDNNRTRLVTTFRLDTRRRMQTMIGFGGALSDATCRNIRSLSASMSKNLMEDYFGARGLRYNMARMTIGSSDFSTTPYTNNDKIMEGSADERAQLLDESDDLEMKRFRLVDEDYEFKLPVARQAIAVSRQEIKFFSSLWSPPVWMKNNSHIVHGWLKGDIYGPYYKALADYIVKWHEAYRKNGLEFWATTGLNEPITGVKPFIFHNSLGISREDYATFIKLYLGPALRQRGFANLKLIVMDDNKGYAAQLINALLADQEVAKYISGVGVHWYMNDEYENLNFLSARNISSKYFLLSTEACNGYLPFQAHTLPGNWDRGVAYMFDILKLVQKNSAGWVDWNMALNLYGGPTWANNFVDAAVIVNPERDEYYKSPAYYAIGHFSRFVEPNSARLDHRLANAKYEQPLEAVGFLTPRDYVVIVALNANRHEVPFKVIVDRKLVATVALRADSFSTIVFKARRAN